MLPVTVVIICKALVSIQCSTAMTQPRHSSHGFLSWVNQYVVNNFLDITTERDLLRCGGMIFQSECPAIENARSPKVTVLLRQGSRGKSDADLGHEPIYKGSLALRDAQVSFDGNICIQVRGV